VGGWFPHLVHLGVLGGAKAKVVELVNQVR